MVIYGMLSPNSRRYQHYGETPALILDSVRTSIDALTFTCPLRFSEILSFLEE